MTKRILAAVLALVMSLSVFAIPAFAAGEVGVTQSGNVLNAGWPAVDGATSYKVDVYKDSTVVSSVNVTTNSARYTVSAAGNYQFVVTANGTAGITTYTSAVVAATYTNSTTSGGLTFTRSGNTVTISWTANTNAASYNVTYSVGGVNKGTWNVTGTSFVVNDVPATSAVSATVTYNTAAGQQNAGTIGTGSTTGSTGTGTGTGVATGNLTVNGRVVSWTGINVTGISYIVKYYYGNSTTPSSIPVSTTFVTVPEGVTKVEVVAMLGTSVVSSLGTVTFTTTGTGTGTGLYVTAGTRTVYWNSVGYGAVYSIYVNGMTTAYQTVNVNSFTVPTGITLVTVKYTYNGQTGTIGTVTMPATGNSTGNTGAGNAASGSSNYFTANGITISKSTAYTIATWTADSAATGYFVTYKNLTTNEEKIVFTDKASIQLPFSYLDKWSISVDKFVNGIRTTIGFTTVYPTGTNTNVSGNTTTAGTNCTVISSATSSTLTWTASTGAAYYKVYYIVNGQSQTTTATTTSVVIPVGNSTDFTVLVVDSNNVTVAYASVKKATNTGSTDVGNTTTTIKNLTLTPKNSWTTTISWDKVSGAAAYLIMYAPYGSSATQEASSLTNSCDIPFGAGSNYVVYVYALLSNGGTRMVGEATHIAGSEGSTAEPEDDTKEYVTNLKGVSGESKKIKLSWDAAKDASKYTIYYKRSANSEWIKAGTTSKCAVNLNGLTNGTKYDFKVVANGNDSGILTIAPSTTSKTVLAEDPEDVETVVLVPEISSATSSKSGTATIKWAKVDGATSYKVYFAEEGSNTYRSKATVSTTSCTITGLDDGTYKVRVKALVDGEWTALADCKYVSVTVK